MTAPQIPATMQQSLSYLEENGFITRSPSPASLRLRELAAEYVARLKKPPRLRAVLLSGSAVVGNAGKGSDLDLQCIVKGRSEALWKTVYRSVVVDSMVTSEEDWSRSLRGENAKYLTHTVPLYDPSGLFSRTQRRLLRSYFSQESVDRECRRVKVLVAQRRQAGLASVERGRLSEAALALESCFFQVCSLLIYCHKGFASTSLLLSETARLAKRLGRPQWTLRAMRTLRLNLPRATFLDLLHTHHHAMAVMRRRLRQHPGLVRKIQRRELPGPFGQARAILEICSTTNARQLRDKVLRCLANGEKADAALALTYESWWIFFGLSPFFYLKNADAKASGERIAATPFHDILTCWGGDVRRAWERIGRYHRLTRRLLRDLDALNREILSAIVNASSEP